MSARFLSLLLLACAAAAADLNFDCGVKAVESRYGARRAHIPLMGVANLFVKVARPSGTSSFRLAMFDNLNSFGESRDDFMDHLEAGHLHSLARVHSGQEGDATYILAGDAGKSTRLLIATFGRNAATVIEVKVNAAALRRTFERPDLAVKSFKGRHDDH